MDMKDIQGFATPSNQALSMTDEGIPRIVVDPVSASSESMPPPNEPQNDPVGNSPKIEAKKSNSIFETLPEDEFDADAIDEKYFLAAQLRSIGVEPFPNAMQSPDDMMLDAPGNEGQNDDGRGLIDQGVQAAYKGASKGSAELFDSFALLAGAPQELAKNVVNMGLEAVGMEPVKNAFGDIDSMRSLVNAYQTAVNDVIPVPDAVVEWASQPYDNEIFAGLVEGGTQFAVGAVPAAKLVKAMTTYNAAARGFIWGAIADFTAMSPDDPILADNITEYLEGLPPEEQLPILQSFVEVIAKNETDPEFVKRAKMALEGGAIGTVVEGAIRVAKFIPFNKIVDASKRAGGKMVDAADARIAERQADTSVTLGAGVDPMPAVDAAISAAGRAVGTTANPNRISTRLPTAVKSTEDPVNEPLQIGLDEIKTDPKIFEHNVGIVKAYPNMTEAEAALPTEEASEAFINHAKNNLLFVFDQVPEQTRQRSKLWYKGANAIANRLADKYDIPDSSVSGVLAALSPQKDWYMNVSLGERTIDILASQRDTKFTKEMMEYKGGWLKESMLDSIVGKTLGELELPAEKAIWLRIYDEVYNDRSHRIVSPEGDFLEIATNADGKPKGTGWGSITEISKAVSAFESGGGKEILTPLMGSKHKVRSFYNNILDPDGPNGDVTIDTHAVAAALLRPLSGQSTEVHHNFGSSPMIAKQKPDWKGATKNSAVTGVQGNYGLYAEAYRRAAIERGVLPREMQSITWEAVRGLFTDTFKSQAKNVDGVNKIWYDYRSGKVSLDEARTAVTEQAGGINPPSWQ